MSGFNTRSVDVHQFAMIPRADIPRSRFKIQSTHKTTFDAGLLIPVYCDEVLPGDSFRLKMTAFARLATPITPILDNLYLDSFFFFVPNRLIWDNWKKFNGEQTNPGDSTSYSIPQIDAKVGGYEANTIFDYFGLPTIGQITGSNTYSHSALPLRAYNLIYNEWFRDENLVPSLTVPKGDGPDLYTTYSLQRRGKRHDYFTSCLPWPQKGDPVRLPLGATAPVTGDIVVPQHRTAMNMYDALNAGTFNGVVTYDSSAPRTFLLSGGTDNPGATAYLNIGGTSGYIDNATADLSAATAATINQIRQAFQIQKLLERDARGGTRYTEIVRAHFGVVSPDARLQRPEYLGGSESQITFSAIAQTSSTDATTPQGNLAAVGTMVAHGDRHGFSQSFTEHGYIIGLVSVRADLTYQQGLRRMWSRQTRFDFYWPAFAQLGEQAVLNKEIYCTGTATDNDVFGYQERWGEYRYNPSMITGLFRSTNSTPLDVWHLAQKFGSLPTLNKTFIEDNPPVSRVVAVGSAANGKQMLFDALFDVTAVRPMPMYSVPGFVDHF